MADEKKSALLKILIIAGIVLVADVVGGYLIIKFVLPMFYKTETAAGQTEKKDKKKKGKEVEAPKVKPLEPIALNPANSSGEILAVEIVLEAHEDGVIEELTLKDAQVRDIVITYLSSRTVAELNDITRRELFKKDMLLKINGVLKSGKVTALYTKSWIIQFE
jgi:flagellar protein FliL